MWRLKSCRNEKQKSIHSRFEMVINMEITKYYIYILFLFIYCIYIYIYTPRRYYRRYYLVFSNRSFAFWALFEKTVQIEEFMLHLPNSSIWNFLQCFFGLIFIWPKCGGAFHGDNWAFHGDKIPINCKQTRRIHNSSANNWFSSPRKGVSTFQIEELGKWSMNSSIWTVFSKSAQNAKLLFEKLDNIFYNTVAEYI